ncbi:MAG: C40 family peptidase [Nisaea sp.]|uniref:C40 family peptidase n=1 Tax=Nisaea sp. TaxID=2024842 RepID=UPI001B165ACE|nr:NlpC/P60 family protein [Nisaea sp.]MBO6559951.1 C40 family peptidase [Nisaea sp.]
MKIDPFDHRLTPARADIAADFLEAEIEAPKYVKGEHCRVLRGTLSVREKPEASARQSTELLFNERFIVYERKDGWAWGQNQTDGYVGYVREEGLGPDNDAPYSNEIQALRSYVFPEPDLKTIPLDMLHLSTRVRVTDVSGKYSRVDYGPGGGWIYSMHLCALNEVEPDYLSTAELFMGAPYGWGGRSSFGIDCSGLVQIALARAGITAPRDSDMQEAAVGEIVEGGLDAAQPGDLLFTAGHVMFLAEPGILLHANGHHMAVAYEVLTDFMDRTKDMDIPIRTIRRILSRN